MDKRLISTLQKPKQLPSTHGQKMLIANMFAGTILMICACITTPFTSALSLIVFTLYLLLLAFVNLTFYFKYLVFLFAIITNITGVAICEFTEIWLTELQVGTSYVGSMPLLIISRWLFITVLFYFDQRFGGEVDGVWSSILEIRKSKWLEVATFFTMILFVLALIDVVRYPPASFAGVDRFNWNLTFSSRIMPEAIRNNLIFLVIFPALSIRYGKRELGIVTMTVLLIYFLWIGEKFGAYFQALYIFVWVYYDKVIRIDAKRLRKIACALILSVVVLIAGAVSIQSFSESEAFSQADYLLSRGAQQGQLWWRMYAVTDSAHIKEFSNEIEAVLFGDPTESDHYIGSKQGMNMVMYQTAPYSVVNNKLATGSSYTEAGYAAVYYYFGAMGPIVFSAIMALLIGALTNALLSALSKIKLLESLVLIRLVISANALLGAFRLMLFGLPSLISIMYLIILYLSRNGSYSVARYSHRTRSSSKSDTSKLIKGC